MIRRKRFFRFTILILAAVICVSWYCDQQVKKAAIGRTYADVTAIPHNHVGLLLGTGKYMASGAENPFYNYRIDAAIALLKAGKIDYLVISGDNGRRDYNEPESMRADLIAAGIDSSRIFLDYAGFRTFDSMRRLKEIFSQDSVTIISQQFHNERALYIAKREHIIAIAFNARDVSRRAGLRTAVREKFARVKVFLDYIFHVQPRFSGPKVQIPSQIH